MKLKRIIKRNNVLRGREITLSKTKKVLVGVASVALTVGLSGCSSNASQPEPPDDQNCDDWEWDNDDGVYECEDYDSNYFGYYFFGGKYYKSRSSLIKTPSYKSYKSSSSFKGGKGFGSGSSFFGG
jgi:hypothetical protein